MLFEFFKKTAAFRHRIPVFRLGERPEKPFLFAGKSLWNLNHYPYKLIATPTRPQIGKTLAFNPERAAVLSARRNLELSRPIQAGHLNRCSKSSLREAHRNRAN